MNAAPLQTADFAWEGHSGATLAAALRQHCAGASWQQVRRLVASGKVSVDGQTVCDPSLRLREGQRVVVDPRAPGGAPRVRAADPLLVHVDRDLAVVRKPAGLATIPGPEGSDDCLLSRATRRLVEQEGARAGQLRVVHRLDKVTSGLLVFARTADAERALSAQFRAHRSERSYLALAHGAAPSGTFRFRIVRNRGDGLRGVSGEPGQGVRAVTHVRVVEQLGRVSLLRCRLETGRTHQIRIHLAHLGHPIVGEPFYGDAELRARWQLGGGERALLHAESLGLQHPRSRRWLSWTEPVPEEFAEVLRAERARA